MVRFINKSYKKSVVRRDGIILITFLGIAFSLWFFGYIRALNYTFNGIVQSVSYSTPQHTPTIKVNDKEYNLVCNTWNENEIPNIEIGDSAVKKKGTTRFIIIRHKY